MFSDSIFEYIDKLIKEYLSYDDYSFHYKKELIDALSHLYSILYKLDIPPWIRRELTYRSFQKLGKKFY